MNVLIVSSNVDVNDIIDKTFGELDLEVELDILDEKNCNSFNFVKAYDLVIINDKYFLDFTYQIKAYVFSHLLKNNVPTIVLLEDQSRVDVYCGLNLIDYFYHPIDWQRIKLRLKNSEKHKLPVEISSKTVVTDKFVVKARNEVNLVDYNDIVFFEKDGKKLFVHLENETLVVQESIKLLMTRVPNKFIRVHNSYVVNTDHISKIREVGNRSYEIMFTNFDKVALMSRYRSDALLKDFYRLRNKKDSIKEMSV